MTGPVTDWRPSASLATLRHRAAMLAQARAFFASRAVLEVETPVMVHAAVTDVHLASARVLLEASAGAGGPRERFVHTSPEYAMKRLLAGGSGDIYQICRVVRGYEVSPVHNPEFTLIEWYRVGMTLDALMDEVESLVRALLAGGQAAAQRGSERVSYREAFLKTLGLDPLEASPAELSAAAEPCGYRAASGPGLRDELLELLMASLVGPRLGRGTLTFVHGYPASQAALARLDPHDARTARRFELYCEGIELANGFHELADAAEQRRRFEADLRERTRAGLPCHSIDERLLAALTAGLPDCAGVALGFDRLVMLATAARHIDAVLAFPDARA